MSTRFQCVCFRTSHFQSQDNLCPWDWAPLTAPDPGCAAVLHVLVSTSKKLHRRTSEARPDLYHFTHSRVEYYQGLNAP